MITRFLIAAPLAIAISAAFLGATASPALAADTTCAQAPAQIRAAAVNAAPDQARKALAMVATGEKICAEGGRFEAAKKFAAAAKALGTDLASLPGVSVQ